LSWGGAGRCPAPGSLVDEGVGGRIEQHGAPGHAGGQPAKSEPCYRDLVALLENTYGDKSPALAQPLASQAKALRALGRAPEADAVEKRLQELQQPSAGIN